MISNEFNFIIYYSFMLTKNRGTIKNGQSRDTGKTGYTLSLVSETPSHSNDFTCTLHALKLICHQYGHFSIFISYK